MVHNVPSERQNRGIPRVFVAYMLYPGDFFWMARFIQVLEFLPASLDSVHQNQA